MPTQKRITINIDGQQHQVAPGATRGNQLQALAAITDQDQLYLEVPREPDVPITPSDLMFLRGGEIFSIGIKDPAIPENPVRRNAITFNLNDQDIKLQHEQHSHAKASGAQIKALVGTHPATRVRLCIASAPQLLGGTQIWKGQIYVSGHSTAVTAFRP